MHEEFMKYYMELRESGENVDEAMKTARAMVLQSNAMKFTDKNLMNEGPNRDQAFNLRELVKEHNAANR